MGAHFGFSPSTAGSHYGHRPAKLLISTYCIVAIIDTLFFFQMLACS